jgi:DNA-binding response OmpR family regulator
MGHHLIRDIGGCLPRVYNSDCLLHPGIVYDRETIIRAVWTNNTNIDPHAVDVIVRRIRVKVEPDHAHPRSIMTTRGTGYSFTDKV